MHNLVVDTSEQTFAGNANGGYDNTDDRTGGNDRNQRETRWGNHDNLDNNRKYGYGSR